MTDKAQRDISRGKRAKLLLEDELLTEAFEALKAGYVAALMSSEARDNEMREKLYIAHNQVDKVRDHLGKIMARGSLARKYLDELK